MLNFTLSATDETLLGQIERAGFPTLANDIRSLVASGNLEAAKLAAWNASLEWAPVRRPASLLYVTLANACDVVDANNEPRL